MELLTLKICFVTFTLIQGVSGWSYLTSRLVEVPEPTAVDLRILVEQDIDYIYTDNAKLVTAVKSRALGACFVVDLDPAWNPSDDDLEELAQAEVPKSFSGDQYDELVQVAGDVVAHMCGKVPVYWFAMLGSQPPPPPRLPPAIPGYQPAARLSVPLANQIPPELVPHPNPRTETSKPPMQQQRKQPVVTQAPVDNTDKGAVNGPSPLGNLGNGDLLEPPVQGNQGNTGLLEPPMMTNGGDGLLEPPMLNPGTEELLEPPVLNPGAGALIEPPVLNGAQSENWPEPPALIPGNLGNDDSDSDKEPFPTPPSLGELLSGMKGDSDRPGPLFPGSARSLPTRDGMVAPPMIGSGRRVPESSALTLAPPKPDFRTPKPPPLLLK